MNPALLKKIAVAAAVTTFPISGMALEFSVGGITYEEFSDEVAAIAYDNKTPDVVIPATVSYQGKTYKVSHTAENIFANCDALVTLSIDPAVSQSLYGAAFQNCVNLRSVSISVTDFSDEMFYNCPKLDVQPLLAQATHIGDRAFAMPEPLICDTFDESPMKDDCTVRHEAFSNRLYRNIICKSELYRLLDTSETESLSLSVDEVWWTSTEGSSMQKLKSFTFNGTSLGAQSCECPSLTRLDLGERVERISLYKTFVNLPSIDFSKAQSLKSLGINDNEKISSLSIPTSVTTLGINNLPALTRISGTDNVTSVQIYECPLIEKLSFPSIEELTGESFYKNKSLKEVYLGPSLKYVSHGVFDSTKNMEDLIYGGTLEQWNAIEFVLSDDVSNAILYNIPHFWYGHGNTKHTCLTELNDLGSATYVTEGAFTGYKGLTKVSLPASVTTLQPYAFARCTNLSNVSLKAEKISQFSFLYCTGLTDFTIGDQLAYIGPAFQSTNATDQTLTVYYGGEFGQWQKVVRDPYAYNEDGDGGYPYFGSCNLMGIANGGFYFNGKLLETAVFDNPEVIDNSLEGNKSLKAIVINCSTGLPEIKANAFKGCTGLTMITYTLKNKSRSAQGFIVGDQAFYGCRDLTEIGILDNLESVGMDAFHSTGWYRAQAGGPVYLTTRAQGKCAYVFSGIAPEGTVVKFDEGTETILGSNLIVSGHAGITGAILPEGLKTIGSGAFSDTNIGGDFEIPSSVENLGWTAGSFKFDNFTIADSETPLTQVDIWGTDAMRNIYIGRDIEPEWQGSIFTFGRWEEPVETLTYGPYVTKVTEMTAIGSEYKDSGLKHLYAKATTPATCEAKSRYNFATDSEETYYPGLDGIDYETCILHVPATSVDAYKAAPGWSLFKNITGDALGVHDVIAAPATGVETHYDLHGRPVAPDAPGLHIIRHADGSVTKARVI